MTPQARPDEGKEKDREAALTAALQFAVGAIVDAIYTEDGLDGEAGERVLALIAEAQKYGTFDQRKVERAEWLEYLNLAVDEDPKGWRCTCTDQTPVKNGVCQACGRVIQGCD